MSSFKIGFISVVLVVCMSRTHAQTAIVIDWPTVTLPSNGVLTGLTYRYEEDKYLNVDKPIDAYLGVPYAEPPVGDLRFADPVPNVIDGEYNATYDRAECLQPNPLKVLPSPPFPDYERYTDEDCLFLSIYTPSPKPASPVPVLVWIHGGAYIFGGGSETIYEPLPIVAQSDIIVVGVNYRMGVYGFLTTGDDVATGNFGLMDQLLALKWVQDNIAAFGGDPTRVTIAGESAGGSSVSQHMLSPLSRGLFQQSIMQSGNTACPWSWSPLDKAVENHREFAEFVDCPSNHSQAMVDCMRLIDEDKLQRRQGLFLGGSIASPVVDGDFIPYNPIEMMRRHDFQVTPTLMGSNKDEMEVVAVFFDLPSSIYEPPTLTIEAVKRLISLTTLYIESPEEIAAVEHQYIDWSVADNATADQLAGYVRLLTDQMFSCPTEFYARALSERDATIYRYEMDHHPAYSVWAGIPQWTGAVHSEDLPFLFAWGLNPTLNSSAAQTHEEKIMSVEWMRYWSNFVISGDPNLPNEDTIYPPWPKYTMPTQEYKVLSLDMRNGKAMRAADCGFWLNYMTKLHIQSGSFDEVYNDWQEQYEMWRDIDMQNWSDEFENYKEQNSCPTPSP